MCEVDFAQTADYQPHTTDPRVKSAISLYFLGKNELK